MILIKKGKCMACGWEREWVDQYFLLPRYDSRIIFYDPIKHIVPKSEREGEKKGFKTRRREKQKTNSDIPFTYANEIDV